MDSITSIQHIEPGTSAINIFPNPFTQYSDVTFVLGQSQKITLSLININGAQHTIYDNLQLPAGKQQFRISKATYKLLPGMYFIQLKTKEGIITRKIVLQ